MASPGWDAKVDTLRMLAGPTICDVVQPGDKPGGAGPSGERKTKPVMMVFYIGGVTYAEIAALRQVAKKGDYDVLIATTKVFNGTSLMRSLMASKSAKLID